MKLRPILKCTYQCFIYNAGQSACHLFNRRSEVWQKLPMMLHISDLCKSSFRDKLYINWQQRGKQPGKNRLQLFIQIQVMKRIRCDSFTCQNNLLVKQNTICLKTGDMPSPETYLNKHQNRVVWVARVEDIEAFIEGERSTLLFVWSNIP